MKEISRRQFIKIFGGATVASSAVLTACKGNNGQSATNGQEPPKDKMTYRVNPNTNEKVSLLGYGMMRLPVVGGGAGRENPDADIDQEMVNKQVDYAIEHGVNYFDTSPAYCQGRSEKATGIALHRHPRDKYFVATKLSNFSPETWSKKASIEMFENSLKELQVEWIDYLLLHAIGGDSRDMDSEETFNARFMDNGLLDWLVEQKKKGRIHNLGFSYHGDVEIFDMLLRWHDEGKYHWDFAQIELNYLDWDWADEINDRNTDASYLYAELEKRGIPAVIMEPLLGGRLANVPDPIVRKMKKQRPEDTVASWAFRYAGTPKGVLTVLSGMTYMEHLRENIGTYAPLEPITKEENPSKLKIDKLLHVIDRSVTAEKQYHHDQADKCRDPKPRLLPEEQHGHIFVPVLQCIHDPQDQHGDGQHLKIFHGDPQIRQGMVEEHVPVVHRKQPAQVVPCIRHIVRAEKQHGKTKEQERDHRAQHLTAETFLFRRTQRSVLFQKFPPGLSHDLEDPV